MQLEPRLRLALPVGREDRVELALLDDHRIEAVAGLTRDVDLHRRWIADESIGPQQPAAGLILGVGQFANVNLTGRSIDLHVQFGAALDGHQARLVRHAVGHDNRRCPWDLDSEK